MNFTFVCCYNNEEQIQSMLLPSLLKIGSVDQHQRADEKYVHILIDNRKGQYTSAAQAYNNTIKNDNMNDVVVFCHQDIAFKNTLLWEHAEEEFKRNPSQMLGVAGMSSEGMTVSNLKYFDSDCYVTKCQVSGTTEVKALDECCFMIPRQLLTKLSFDEATCPSWHLYAADFCYAARTLYGINSYVLPDEIYHKKTNMGGLYTDNSFLRSIWRMTRKYHHVYPIIYTPCYIVSTNPIKATVKLSRTFIKNLLREWIYQSFC